MITEIVADIFSVNQLIDSSNGSIFPALSWFFKLENKKGEKNAS